MTSDVRLRWGAKPTMVDHVTRWWLLDILSLVGRRAKPPRCRARRREM